MLAPQFERELKQENCEKNFVERGRMAIQQKLTGRRSTIEEMAPNVTLAERSHEVERFLFPDVPPARASPGLGLSVA